MRPARSTTFAETPGSGTPIGMTEKRLPSADDSHSEVISFEVAQIVASVGP
jgi:hypothetical protein